MGYLFALLRHLPFLDYFAKPFWAWIFLPLSSFLVFFSLFSIMITDSGRVSKGDAFQMLLLNAFLLIGPLLNAYYFKRIVEMNPNAGLVTEAGAKLAYGLCFVPIAMMIFALLFLLPFNTKS